jgi:NAD-dependent SIR2 family protein deacetylase
LFILSGAGLSAESGVPTFRSSGGLWEGHRFEDVVFVCIGTSGQVYPAAGFADLAVDHGCKQLIEVNLNRTAITTVFGDQRSGKAGELVPRLVDELLSRIES